MRGRMQLAGGNNNGLAHSAVGVNSQYLQANATVRFAGTAGNAMATVQIRLHRTLVAGMHVSRSAANRCDLHAKLVTKNPRVAKKRLVSVEGMNIGATDANPAHANQRFVRFQ